MGNVETISLTANCSTGMTQSQPSSPELCSALLSWPAMPNLSSQYASWWQQPSPMACVSPNKLTASRRQFVIAYTHLSSIFKACTRRPSATESPHGAMAHKTNKNMFSASQLTPARVSPPSQKHTLWFSSPSWLTVSHQHCKNSVKVRSCCQLSCVRVQNCKGLHISTATGCVFRILSMQAYSLTSFPFLCLNWLRLSAVCSAFITIAPLHPLSQLSSHSSNVHTAITGGSSPNIYCCLLKVHLMWAS